MRGKGFTLLGVAVAGLLAADGLGAEGSNSLPYTNTFESYAAGYRIADEPGWNVAYGMTGASVVVSSQMWCSNSPSPYVPTGAAHSNVLSIEGVVSNVFAENSPDFVYIDFSMLPAYRDKPPTREVQDTPQAAIYVNSQSNLVFYHRWWDQGYITPVWSTNTDVQIPSNEWVRLTIEFAHNNYTADYFNDSFYRIQINGNTNYFSNSLAYNLEYVGGTPPESNLSGGPRDWFMCANSENTGAYSLHSFAVSGFAQIDDFYAGTNMISTNAYTYPPSTNCSSAPSTFSELSAPVIIVR